jgi:multiple sugar transport system substrate-binding protein
MGGTTVRKGIVALMLIAVTGLLAGCLGSSGGDTDEQGGKITLTLWHQEQPPNRVKAFGKVIDKFNASQDKYVVKQQVQNWEDIYQKATSAIQAQKGPDLQFAIPDFTTAMKPTGAVQPVDDIVDELDSEHKFLPSAVQPYTYENHTWAVPVFGMVQMLWYRKDLFRKAGLDPDAPPKTWDELMADAQKLTGNGTYGIGIPSSKHLYTDQEIYSFMTTNGGKDLFDENGKVRFDTPENVKTFDFYTQLSKFSPKGSNSWTWAEPQAALNNGTLAMAIEKGQFLGPFTKESGRPAKDLGVAPIPVAPGGERGSIYYSNAVMLMTKDPKKKEAAKAFLAFLFEPDNYATWLLAEPGLFLPVTEDGDSPAWRDSKVLKQYPDAVEEMLEQSNHGALFGFTGDKVSPAIGKISAENMLSQVVQQAVVRKEDPKAAVQSGQKMMEDAAEKAR